MFPDDEWRVRDRLLDEREQELDAREQRLSDLDRDLTARQHELAGREGLVAEREVAAEERERVANEREAVADGREQQATARERVLDRRAVTHEPGRPDPVGRIEEAFAREVSRLDRSDAFLQRSREAVQRAQARLDSLRAAKRDQKRPAEVPVDESRADDPETSS
jgi:hypothetical protein